jgi:type IV pilus assembly PilX-like protein
MRIVNSGTSSPAGQRGARSGDSGNAMVVALLVLMVLTTAGVAYIAVTKSEKQIAGNSMTATQALYAAEAGITEGLHRMAYPAESLNYIGPTAAPTAGWGRYIVIASGRSALDPDRAALATDGMDNDGDGLIDEPNETYPEVLTKQTISASTLRYPYVRVEYKTQGGNLILFGDADNNPATPPVENLTKGTPVLRITARGRQGNADKMLEAEAVRFPIIQVASAIWTGGKLDFDGNAFNVDGHDHHALAPHDTLPGATPTPGVMTRGNASDVTMAANQEDNVNGSNGEGSVTQSGFTYDFNAMWAQFVTMADNSYNGAQAWSGVSSAFGSYDNPKVTVVNGNLTATGNWTGGGILVVNGNLDMRGGSAFTGVVICLGDVDFAGGGASDLAHVTGGLIYQGTVVNSSRMHGSSDVYYSTEAINAANSVGHYTLSWWRER